MIVYKYLQPLGITVLLNTSLRFSQPAILNDPFELMPNALAFFESAVRFRQNLNPDPEVPATDEDLQLIRQVALVEFGKSYANRSTLAILSLTKNRNNLLMWAHYCDSHRGFVLGFDSTDPFFVFPKPGEKGDLREVKYSSERPVLPTLDNLDDARTRDYFQQAVNVFTKSKHWEYENEWRMCASPAAADDTKPGSDSQPIYLFKFPPESLMEVILGHRMSDEKRVEITSVVREKFLNAKLYQAVLNEAKYDLDVVPLPGSARL